jgi:hypothetical protein
MIRALDRSARLSALIKRISGGLAAQRGMPVLIAIALTIISLIVHIVWVETGNAVVGIIGFVILHLAILIGFLGVLLSEPIGRG